MHRPSICGGDLLENRVHLNGYSAATAVVSRARQAAEKEGVGFPTEESSVGINYSKALPQRERMNQPVVQTALATANFFRKAGSPEIVLADRWIRLMKRSASSRHRTV
jgi:hypothetical protein